MEYREKFGLAALLTHLQFVSSASVSVHISATRLIMRLYCVLCSMLFIIIIIRGICINLFSSSGGDSLLIRVFHKVTTHRNCLRESVFTVLFLPGLVVRSLFASCCCWWNRVGACSPNCQTHFENC